jgi:hypothetical protein
MRIPIQLVDKESGKVIREYSSIAEAASSFNLDESTVRKVLNKTNRTAGGFVWKTADKMLTKDYNTISNSKILLLDIETAPLEAYIWRLWKQVVRPEAITSDWFMLTWAAKWLGEEYIYSRRLSSREAIDEDDGRIVSDLWEFMDEADIVIAHNASFFDIPRINSRFLINKLSPPSSYKQIDTLVVAKRGFSFSGNSLDDLARIFKLEGKSKTAFSLWIGCKKGEDSSLKEMEDYNREDVRLLEEVYLKMRPYIKGHPNLDLYIDSENPVCPSCGEDSLIELDNKFFYTQAVKYKLYRCASCKSLARSKTGIKFENKKQISPIPR